MVRRERHSGWLVHRRLLPGCLIVAALVGLAAALYLPGGAVAAGGGVWRGTAEGIRVNDGKLNSGSVTSSSVSDYQVELSFSFSVSPSGQIVGGGNGYYTDAHWHLFGVNGENGSFDCEPPVAAPPFKVIVGGHVGAAGGALTLAIPAATETNQDYDCGAKYTGYATTTHDMKQSLDIVGGDRLQISATQPTSLTLTKTVDSGGATTTEHDTHIWSFSISPPSSQPNNGSGGGSGAGGGGGGGSCSLSLTGVTAKPSPGRAGQPIAVSFHVSAPAHAVLFVAPVGGAGKSVAAGDVAAGANALVWGGWLGSLPAKAGQYKLTVHATACGTKKKRGVLVTTR